MKNRIVSELLAAARGKRPAESEEGRQEASEIQEQLREAMNEAERLVTAHPLIVLGAAVVAGVMLGWWIKRT